MGLQIYIRDNELGLNILKWYFRLFSVKSNYDRDPWHAFGFSYADAALHLRWGKRTKVIWMPWDWGANIRNEVQNEKGEFVLASDVMESIARKWLLRAGVSRDSLWNLNIPDGRKMYESTYRYILKNGEVQERVAKYYVGEREWRWRIFHPLAIGPKKVSRTINIDFDKEVGEGTGSWKGGCLGCGYEMLPGETPEQTLRRMERERKFSR